MIISIATYLKEQAKKIIPDEIEYRTGITPRPKPMVFKVGEGLSPEGKIKAEATVRKANIIPFPASVKPSAVIKELPYGIKQTGLGIGGFLKDVAQGIARSGGSLALSALEPITKQKELKPSAGFSGIPQKLIFGEAPLKTFAEQSKSVSQWLKEKGHDVSPVKTLPLAVAYSAIDFTGAGGSKNVLKIIAKSKKIEEILTTLKKIGVADDIAKIYAPKLVKIANEKEVKSVIDNIAKIQQETKISPITKPVSKITPQPLAQEAPIMVQARKAVAEGKGAEEFVNDLVFHGGKGDYSLANATTHKTQMLGYQKKFYTPGLSTSKNIDVARDFITKKSEFVPQGGKLKVGIISKDAKVFESINYKPELKSVKTDDVVDYARRKKFDVIDFSKDNRVATYGQKMGEQELRILNPKSITEIGVIPNNTSKSQLTDIYNQALKEAKPVSKITPQPLAQEVKGVKPVSKISEQPAKLLSQTEELKPPAIPPSAKMPISPEMAPKLPAKNLTSYKINVKNFNINDAEKKIITTETEAIRPKIESIVGKKLSNQEVKTFADNTSQLLERTVGREQTKKWEAAMFNLRQRIASEAKSGTVDKEFIDDLLVLKTQGSDIARKLQSLGMEAEPKNLTNKQAIIEAVMKVNDNVDEILKAAKGVDFNNYKQAAEFYRKFIKPTSAEWLDLLRYNSMLSSPLTHIVNTTSNAINSAIVAPVEKTLTGGVDFLGSKITGKPQTSFTGEGLAYFKNYYKGIGEATKRFIGVMKGERTTTNLDIKYIPPAVKGIKGAVAKGLSLPMRLLEASDQFFTALSESGERAAIVLKTSKGVKTKFAEQVIKDKAAYRLFRQDLFNENQGTVLDAVDQLTSKMMSLRNNPNSVISMIAKFTVPFVKTPMNIFKQGIEYSPLGFTTVYKAGNASEQIAKALMGTAMFGGISAYAASDRLTFGEPTSEKERNMWRAAGKQAYSIKIGNNWISYQKMPPMFSFPMAMIAGAKDAQDKKKIDDDTVDLILSSVSKWGEFFADQSYFKSMGDLLSAVQGEPAAISRLLSNYPQQLIPMRAFSGWLARMMDETQRKIDTKATFVDKQIQLLMMNIPYLSQKVPARLDEEGKPIPAQNKVLNALSPFRISTENKQLMDFLNNYKQFKKETGIVQQEKTKERERMQPIYDKIQDLVASGNFDEAMNKVNNLSEEDYAIYKKIKASDKSKETQAGEVKIYPIVKKVQELVKQEKTDEAMKIINNLTEEEYRWYQKAKVRMGL